MDSGELVRFLGEATTPQARRAGTPENAAPAGSAARSKDAGGGDVAVASVAVRHLESLAYKLAAGDVVVEGIQRPAARAGAARARRAR